ncbi:MAG: hypothetical protein GYB68_17745, partial [Chloroflexi bacterium]|nr:hypothetical protein [Chloroflexota bacterium]
SPTVPPQETADLATTAAPEATLLLTATPSITPTPTATATASPTAGPALETLLQTPQADYLNARLDDARSAYEDLT